MRMWKMVVVIASLLGLTQVIWSQSVNEDRESTISRSFGSRTTALTPTTQGSTLSPEALAALTPTTGTFVFNFTITVLSTIPKNGVIFCNANANVSEPTTGTSFNEKASGFPTLVSGNTWSCTATIHYSWPLSTPSTDKVSLFDDSGIAAVIQLTAANSTATTVVGPFDTRKSSRTAGTLSSVPSTGTTTTVNIGVTL